MSESPKPGAHSCVVHPELKNAQPSLGGRYGRMFPALPICEVELDSAVALGRAASRTDATLPAVEEALENLRIPAEFAILGQFMAHDITADRSFLARHAVTGELTNSRIPRLDLECFYGDGPVGNPFLYDREDPHKLLLGADAAGEPDDLPLNHQGTALVGDPRDDVHLLIAKLHVAFLRFHNRAVDWLCEKGVPGLAVFDEARRLVRWHYEWIVVHEFLPLSAGEEVLAGVELLSSEECEVGADWRAETPLWYYVLREAGVCTGGEHLGLVGRRIVAEVLLGLLDADLGSYRSAEPGWRPTLPSAEPEGFRMADLVVFAGTGGTAGTSR